MTTLTIALIITVTVGLSAYDILPAANAVDGDTISEVLRRWGQDWGLVMSYIWGGLGGHFWAGVPGLGWPAAQELSITAWSIWVVLVLNVGFQSQVQDWPWWAPVLVMAAGALVFSVTWSQA